MEPPALPSESSEPAESPQAEDEPVLAREPLATDAPGRGIELRPLLNALSLALAAVLVVVAAAVGIQRLRQQPTTRAAAPTLSMPTATLPLTPAPTMPAGQGWTRAGPRWAQQIVFAPSAPLTAYTCGTPANSDGYRLAPLVLGISLDSGQTWRTVATGIRATLCQVDVDPNDARDLLLQVERCSACATQSPTQLYRSLDGGASWHLVRLPPLPGAGSASFASYQWAWQGSTLFVMSFLSVAQFQGDLAVSVAEGPLAWVNEHALLAGVPPSLQLNTVYATDSAVYADFVGPSGCTGTCETVKRSTDLGNTWAVFQPQYRGQPVYLLDQTVSIADGRTLIAQIYPTAHQSTRIYVRSSDGGATWAPLPSPPGNLIIISLASTPGGIFYAETWSFGVATATPAVYRLAPGAPGWTLVGALPAAAFALVVSWNEQGKPLALWSGASSPQSAQVVTAGLATHAP